MTTKIDPTPEDPLRADVYPTCNPKYCGHCNNPSCKCQQFRHWHGSHLAAPPVTGAEGEGGDAPVPRLRAALAALHPSARYVRVEAIDLDAALRSTAPALDGTETNCPLEGVHEHPFRGPHRFREWEPGT